MNGAIMQVVDVSEFADCLVIHFATGDRRINAYTLASTLVGIADAAKAANASLNPGHNIEIVVEAIGPGSFRAQIKALYSAVPNLFSKENIRAIVLGIITTFIYEHTFSTHPDVKVEIKTNEVIIERGSERIIVPRDVYDATRLTADNPQFVGAIGRTMEIVSRDESVTGFAIVPRMDSPTPQILIPREILPQIAPTVREEGNSRIIEENCDLQIVKAILERSNRKWEFRWRGVKISAPVTDQHFYTEFFAHNIRIAPGDELKAHLLITQTKDEETGIYSNIGYEVVQIFEHVPRMQQQCLPNGQ
jgi:hypothetical protein